MGILGWCSVVAICFFSSTITKKDPNNQKLAQFLFISALVTCILMVDDLFLFHERVFPDYLHIRQRIVYLAYIILIIVYLLYFYQIILRTDFTFLFLAFVFFAVSVSIDLISEFIWIPELFFFEDGIKFLGILSWATYYIRTCFQVMSVQINKI